MIQHRSTSSLPVFLLSITSSSGMDRDILHSLSSSNHISSADAMVSIWCAGKPYITIQMQTLAKRDTILDLLRLSLAGKSTIPYTADSSQEILQHISVVLQRRCYCAKYNRLSLTENYSATYMAVPPKKIQEFHRFATFVLALKWNAKVPVSMEKKLPWCMFPLTLTAPSQSHTHSCHQLEWLWRRWRLHKEMGPCTVWGSGISLYYLKLQRFIEKQVFLLSAVDWISPLNQSWLKLTQT